MEKFKFHKEVSQEILKEIYKYILVAIGIIAYFCILNLAFENIKLERLVGDIEVFSGVFLAVGIYLLEKAYKKDSGKLIINAIELFTLSIHSLTITHIITLMNIDFRLYLLFSSYAISSYFVLKSIIIYTKGRKEYAKSFSDISEIVKKDEPKKKEAVKTKNRQEEKNTENINLKTKSTKNDKSTSKKTRTKGKSKKPTKKKNK